MEKKQLEVIGQNSQFEKIEPGDFNMQLMRKQYVEVVREHPLADKSKNSLQIVGEVFRANES